MRVLTSSNGRVSGFLCGCRASGGTERQNGRLDFGELGTAVRRTRRACSSPRAAEAAHYLPRCVLQHQRSSEGREYRIMFRGNNSILVFPYITPLSRIIFYYFVVPLSWALHRRATFSGNISAGTFFGVLCQRNLRVLGIVHTRKRLRAPTLICWHAKNIRPPP